MTNEGEELKLKDLSKESSEGGSVISSQIEKAVSAAKKEIVDEFDKKIEERQEKTTEILAIFITLFTFISVNVNIFTRVSDLFSAIWFVILMTACSVILVSILIILVGRDKKENFAVFFLVLSFVGLLILLFITSYPNWSPRLNTPENTNLIQVTK